MNPQQINYHLHNNLDRIREKWNPVMSVLNVIQISNQKLSQPMSFSTACYLDDLLNIFSSYCEWWEITKPNYDGLGDSLDRIISKMKINHIENINQVKELFYDDFIAVYDIQNHRDNIIEKLYETD